MQRLIFVATLAAVAATSPSNGDETHNTKDPAATRIESLIRNLANIEHPYVGLSSTLSGEAFAPLHAVRPMEILMTDHNIKESADLVELVKLGPKALPYLLDALDDQTPTKLMIKHDSFIGAMWFANELSGNPSNPWEKAILPTQPKPREEMFKESFTNRISSYPIKVGDVCFVIIGQIVGRPYLAVRYQMTLCTVIISPTHDTNLAWEVRSIWSSNNPVQHLLDSLLLDYDAKRDGQRLEGSSFQISAATRLLYYYPQQTTNLIAERLRNLDVRGSFLKRDLAKGMATTEFIKAVYWSKEPAILAELQRIFRISDDADILAATVVVKDTSNSNVFRKRLETLISRLPKEENQTFTEGYTLLLTLGQYFGAEVRPAFESYMRKAGFQRRRDMCHVLSEAKGEWSVDLLASVLEDTRPSEGWSYSVVPNQDEPRLPIRLCDEAAETISKNFPRLSFKMEGTHSDLDRQIQKMREQIARHDY